MEKNTKSLSVSFRVDSGIVSHNNRDFIAKNVDSGRIKDNITYVRQDIHEVYNELFGAALAEYNAKQKKASRKITDYYEHIQKSDRVKPYYEIVVQFGDIESCGQNSGRWEQAKLMLDEYIRGFEQRNPNLKVFNAVMHLDEATPHLHIDFIPIAHKVKSGLSVKVSMKGALQEQGFSAVNRLDNEWKAWEESERDVMISILHSHDLSRDVKNVNRAHLDVDDYKRYAAQQLEVKKLNEQINKGVIYVLDNDSNISNIANQLLTISDYNIHSSEQMYDMEKTVKQKISDLSDNVKSQSDEIATLKSDISQLHFLFSDLSVSSKRMDAMTKTKIAAAQQIADRRGITTEEEITALEKRLDEMSNAIRSAKSELSEEQKKLKRVNELIDTYEKIVKGNYIDNLIKAQKELTRAGDSLTIKKS